MGGREREQMKDVEKSVRLDWLVTVLVSLSFLALPRYGSGASGPSSSGKSSPVGSPGSDLSATNPLLEKLSFPCKGPTTIKGSEWLTVDPETRYTLSGWFRSAGKEPSNIYLGFMCFDADKKPIASEHVGVLGATETALYEDCKKEDTVIKVVHAFKWKENSRACVAFDADDSGRYKDLPNRNLSGFGINKLDEKDGYWEVHLNGPCGQAYPAGTKVREHFAGPAYLYCAASAQAVPTEWTQYSGTVLGIAGAGAGNARWWKGTKYAKLILLVNYQQSEDCIALVSGLDIKAETP